MENLGKICVKGDSLLASATNACRNSYYQNKTEEERHTLGVTMAALRLVKDGVHEQAHDQRLFQLEKSDPRFTHEARQFQRQNSLV